MALQNKNTPLKFLETAPLTGCSKFKVPFLTNCEREQKWMKCQWLHVLAVPGSILLYFDPQPGLVSDSTRLWNITPDLGRVTSCHAVASDQSSSPLQATFIKTSNGAASNGTNIALCHHYFNNFEYFEYFNHWVTPWMPGLIFQIWWLPFNRDWSANENRFNKYFSLSYLDKVLIKHLVSMFETLTWGLSEARARGGLTNQWERGRPACWRSLGLSQPRAEELRSGHGPPALAQPLPAPDTRDMQHWSWPGDHTVSHQMMMMMPPVSGGSWLIVPLPGLCHCSSLQRR